MFEFKLPSLGADMDEGKLLEWLVRPGDRVVKGQVVAIVDTSKAAVDVEIWQDGTVHELLVEPGTRMAVGTVMATLLEPGEAPAAKRTRTKTVKAAAAAAVPVVEAPAAKPAPDVSPAPAGRLRVSPAARKRAEALGVELAALSGSGPGGAVTLEDVERAVAAARLPASPPAATPSPISAAERQAETRRAIAAARIPIGPGPNTTTRSPGTRPLTTATPPRMSRPRRPRPTRAPAPSLQRRKSWLVTFAMCICRVPRR